MDNTNSAPYNVKLEKGPHPPKSKQIKKKKRISLNSEMNVF